MKTFLRTTLFRLVALIALLIVSGFGNLVPQGLLVNDYYYLVKFLPNQAKAELQSQGYNTCMQETTIPTPTKDPAMIIETDGITNATTLPAALPSEVQQPDLIELQIDIASIKEQITQQFNQLYTQLSYEHSQLAQMCLPIETTNTPIIDLNAQKKAELQAQIEALQMEINNL